MGVITRGIANNILSGGTIDATDGLSGTVSASNITDSSISSVTAFPAAAGDFIQSTASDPSPATIGDVWYNNATYALKVASITTAGAWASGGTMGTARYDIGSAGTQTATLAFGGYAPPGGQNATEAYNGTAWTTLSNLPTAIYYHLGTGTQTAAISVGGDPAPQRKVTNKWNGSSWTVSGSTSTDCRNSGLTGLQTAALKFGGDSAPSNNTQTELYNGTSWTTSPATLNTGRSNLLVSGIGTQTAALAVGGYNGTPVANVESYNGTSWTALTAVPTAFGRNMGSGTQTSALTYGDNPSPAKSFLWNGTSWTATTNLSTPRTAGAGTTAGTQTSALAAGGTSPTTGVTEEWTGPGSPVTQTLTTS